MRMIALAAALIASGAVAQDSATESAIGPDYADAPEMAVNPKQAMGSLHGFVMLSSDSTIYPGIRQLANDYTAKRDAYGNRIAAQAAQQSEAAPYRREVIVYVPAGYRPNSETPFMVVQDGRDYAVRVALALDTLIAQHRVPAMVAVMIQSGGGDAQGSERGLEYDTMSGRYAEFVETEVLPLVETQARVKLTRDPDARATMGSSSGGACALIMAWYRPDLYHRVLSYSGTFINQQWPYDPKTPHGAWEFHEVLIPETPAKPIRIWMEVGDRDLLNPNVMRDGMHDWVLANENMAKVLADKNYHYQFVFVRNAGHVDRAVVQQTLPEALEYVWQGYTPPAR